MTVSSDEQVKPIEHLKLHWTDDHPVVSRILGLLKPTRQAFAGEDIKVSNNNTGNYEIVFDREFCINRFADSLLDLSSNPEEISVFLDEVQAKVENMISDKRANELEEVKQKLEDLGFSTAQIKKVLAS